MQDHPERAPVLAELMNSLALFASQSGLARAQANYGGAAGLDAAFQRSLQRWRDALVGVKNPAGEPLEPVIPLLERLGRELHGGALDACIATAREALRGLGVDATSEQLDALARISGTLT